MSQKLFQTLKDSVERAGSLVTCFHKTYFSKVRKTENRQEKKNNKWNEIVGKICNKENKQGYRMGRDRW